ncbi:uncharacterized protein LOC117666634 isoform X3 [Pantherophis guttatus]|uniref:Uncharacterized protein LOC117666634 isoform X3 n=1 Tax=Pantherophis guttatus TaxID=94885 RepID=A0ABM3Z9D6_PANGU|nr:uncharacterized protein LOC117666634 isoform X3 [Pantherophis guttatus]
MMKTGTYILTYMLVLGEISMTPVNSWAAVFPGIPVTPSNSVNILAPAIAKETAASKTTPIPESTTAPINSKIAAVHGNWKNDFCQWVERLKTIFIRIHHHNEKHHLQNWQIILWIRLGLISFGSMRTPFIHNRILLWILWTHFQSRIEHERKLKMKKKEH